MSSNFVPFPASGSPASRPPQPAFAPVISKATEATSGPHANSNPGTPEGKAKKCAPIVDVEREGERITRIRVQCSCGEVIELDCQY
jgi:hypothetical protein